MQLPILATVLALAEGGLSLPARGHNLKSRAVDNGISAALLEKIMPLSASCDGRGDQCTNSTVAAPYLHQSMIDWKVTNAVEKAGILALIAYESSSLQYKENLSATERSLGRGTANEQAGNYNVDYATALGILDGRTAADVLELTSNPTFNFGSGAWYYSTHCAAAQAMDLSDAAADAWFAAYAKCVVFDTAAQPERLTFFETAKAAYSIS